MLKTILQTAGILAMLTLAFAFAQAHGAEPPTTVKSFNPIAVLMVQIDDVPARFVLVNAKGEIAAIDAQKCAQSKDCVTIVAALIKGGHGSELNFNDGKTAI